MLSSTPSSTTSQQHYLMYDEDNTTVDHKINDDRMILSASAATENLMASSSGSGSSSAGAGSVGAGTTGGSFGMGIGMNSGATAGHGGRLPGYWQHAATSAAGYWSTLFDSWTNNSIATGSQSLSLTWDDNRNQ
ncbi:uncharacterized protein LOC106693441 [Microplitis demolitor]|uniref:uncharacterized protein LOC106693441 n=1 Tax=Microplitis demolitor TaxID=69319 RepID=UPI0006D4CD9F|nr:uncharacterized protein LOC106693441 [Microplitis demolitor]